MKKGGRAASDYEEDSDSIDMADVRVFDKDSKNASTPLTGVRKPIKCMPSVGYCCGIFAKTTCRVAAGAAAAAGTAAALSETMGLPAIAIPVAALMGAVGAFVSRAADDLCDAPRRVKAKGLDRQGACRQFVEIIAPVPDPVRTFTPNLADMV